MALSELIVTLLRLSYLALLWIFVLSAIGVLRRDIYGTKVIPRRGGASRRRSAPSPVPPRGSAPAAHAEAATANHTVPQAPASGAGPTKLVITEGKLRGAVIPLSATPVTIGRHPSCTLVLDDDFSSNQHARIYPQAGNWYVEDLRSTNGTYLGRDRVTDPVPVRPGEQIRIGRTVMELQR